MVMNMNFHVCYVICKYYERDSNKDYYCCRDCQAGVNKKCGFPNWFTPNLSLDWRWGGGGSHYRSLGRPLYDKIISRHSSALTLNSIDTHFGASTTDRF